MQRKPCKHCGSLDCRLPAYWRSYDDEARRYGADYDAIRMWREAIDEEEEKCKARVKAMEAA